MDSGIAICNNYPMTHATSEPLADLFFAGKRHPYYIVVPPYKHSSAGVVTQYMLCHLLNRLGYPAFLIIRPNLRGIGGYRSFAPHPHLITPLLTPEIARLHFAEGLTPITLYSETTRGNPLRAPFVARYVLYYSGLLGGDASYAADEYLIAFSEAIKHSLPRCDAVISFPVADPREWSAGRSSARSGRYYYGEKYIRTFGGKIPEAIEKTAIRITRDQPDSLTRPELIQALKSAEYIYIFEDTAMIYEAVLAGCIPIIMKTPHFTELLGAKENGTNGIAMDNTPEEIERARATQGIYIEQYIEWMEKGLEQTRSFAEDTQRRAGAVPYEQPLTPFLSAKLRRKIDGIFGAPVVERAGLVGRLALAAFRIMREQGWSALLRQVRKFVAKKRNR